VAQFQGELSAVREERDYLRDELAKEHEARIAAEREAARLAGKLEVLEARPAHEEGEGIERQRRPSWLDRLRRGKV
jgi:hypothetical protein